MQGQKIVVFGGSGFLGRQVVQALARQGACVVAAVRRPSMAASLRTMGEVGQVAPVCCDITNKKSVESVLQGADAAINLVGLLFEKGKQTFDKVHVEGAKNVAAACQSNNVKRLIHVSALGPEVGSKARYAQTKLKGEKAVLKAFPEATLLRPSLVYGPNEASFSLYARLLQISPFVPLFGGGKTKFQPVFIGDVTRAVTACLDKDSTKGHLYALGGPDTVTFKDLISKVASLTDRKVTYLNLPFSAAKAIASVLSLLPTPLLTRDQVRMLQSDSIVKKSDTKTFQDLSIAPSPLDLKLPGLLKAYRTRF